MRLALGLLVWLTLAGIGIASAGFWGFLGIAVLYVLYYGLLRPRVTVHVSAHELEAAAKQEQANRAARNAIALGNVATTLKAFSGEPRTRSPKTTPNAAEVSKELAAGEKPILAVSRSPDEYYASWLCRCGARNANRRSRCRVCDEGNPA